MKVSAISAPRSTTLCPSRLSLFLLVVTKITVSAASALTLYSRVAAGQDAGSIASITEDSALDVFTSSPLVRPDWVSNQMDVG